MKVWVDMTASAHVLVFRPLIEILRGRGDALAPWQAELAQEFLPDVTVLALPDGIPALGALLDKPVRPEPVNAWLCRGVTCLAPMSDLVHLKKTLKEQA